MMKRKQIIALALILSMGVPMFPISANAQGALPEYTNVSEETATSGTCGENLIWKFSEDGVLTISGTGEMEDYGKINEETGERIFDSPWYESTLPIKKVVIEDGVTSIGNYAFFYCDTLTEVSIPNSVTDIGDSAFRACYYLESIIIPDSVTNIGNHAFSSCLRLTNVKLSESLTTIGDYAFMECPFTSIEIPNTVTSIGERAFYVCQKLESIVIPDSVTSIGGYAFGDCNLLSSIKLPKSLTRIENGLFHGCNFSSLEIPDGVTSIGVEAFSNCTQLESVTIPDSVVSINDFAFVTCTSLKEITIPDSVTSIGEGTFLNCPALSDVYYYGTEKNWSAIAIGNENECLLNASILFNAFKDVKKSDWFYDSVDYVRTEGIMNGTGDGTTFSPTMTTNRAMIVTMLHRLEGSPSVAITTQFTDVAPNVWYAEAVSWALKAGVSEGTGNGTTFSPDNPITREQLATMLFRYAKVEDYTPTIDLAASYPDANKVSSWAKKELTWAVEMGLITGKASGNTVTLAPADVATRAEAATIFQRFCENILK